MWTPITRRKRSRAGPCYETDLTDAAWALINPLMPEPATCGPPPVWTMPQILNAIFYIVRGGIEWRPLLKNLPPQSPTYGDFRRWRITGLLAGSSAIASWQTANGSDARPHRPPRCSTGRRVETTESGSPRGHDAGEKVKGRTRQALVDTGGPALVLDPPPADVRDRDGAVPVLSLSRRTLPFIAKAFADAGYAGDRPATATIITVDIVRKPPGQVGFAVHPRRWVVEGFFARISRHRRLWKNRGDRRLG